MTSGIFRGRDDQYDEVHRRTICSLEIDGRIGPADGSNNLLEGWASAVGYGKPISNTR